MSCKSLKGFCMKVEEEELSFVKNVLFFDF